MVYATYSLYTYFHTHFGLQEVASLDREWNRTLKMTLEFITSHVPALCYRCQAAIACIINVFELLSVIWHMEDSTQGVHPTMGGLYALSWPHIHTDDTSVNTRQHSYDTIIDIDMTGSLRTYSILLPLTILSHRKGTYLLGKPIWAQVLKITVLAVFFVAPTGMKLKGELPVRRYMFIATKSAQLNSSMCFLPGRQVWELETGFYWLEPPRKDSLLCNQN